jgi:hypothetical protein
MQTFQNMIVDALKSSGHTVALVDRKLRIRWATGIQRSLVGAPVQVLWKGAVTARKEMSKVVQNLACGNGCSAEYRQTQGKLRGKEFCLRIDFIPLRDPTGAVEGFAAVRQMASSAAIGVAEVYELLFELNADEFSGLLAS